MYSKSHWLIGNTGHTNEVGEAKEKNQKRKTNREQEKLTNTRNYKIKLRYEHIS